MKKQNKNGTRSLMGIDELTGHSIETPMGELVFYIIQPTNIGVLPESSITARVRGLQGLLSGQTDWELMALNSRESFEANKSFYRQRREKEPLPVVRRLLELDSQHLDDIQVRLASGREFCLVLRLRGQKESDILPYLSRIEQIIKNNGFTTRMAGKQEIQQMLAVYYEQNMTADGYEDYDGQRWEEVNTNGKTHKESKEKRNPRGKTGGPQRLP